MGASNWAVCPRCAKRREIELAKRAEQVKAMYGKESIEDFDHARQKLADDQAQSLDQTFRETYEIWGADEGVVRVSYSGGCSLCSLSLSFKHEHPLDVSGAQ